MIKHQWAYQQLGWNDLDQGSRQLFESIELDMMTLQRHLRRIDEAVLNNDQVKAIFTGAEKVSREKGLRTGFGKAVSFPKETLLTVNRILGNFGKKLQDSGPVKGIDDKFDQLKSKLKSSLGKTENGRKALAFVDSLGESAKRHPAWQGAIIGLLTAVAGLALGPASIPVVAFLLKGATELVKGEKLSTAVGKGLYAGALGFLSAQVASALMGWAESLRISGIDRVGPQELGFRTINISGSSSNTVAGMEWTRWFRVSNVTVDPATQGLINDAILRMGSGDLGAYDRLLSIARRVASPEYLAELRGQLDAATNARINNDGFVSSIRAIKNYVIAAAGGAGAAAAGAGEKPSAAAAPAAAAPAAVPAAPAAAPAAPTKGAREPSKRREPTLENQIELPILEGMWADLTLKFGAGKLMKAWQEAGRPMDSVEIAQMLATMGMDKDDIRQLMIDAGLSEEDVNDTMKRMLTAFDDEVEVPFKSGYEDFDKEAERIFATKGEEAFAKYWEDKLKDLESSLKTTPAAEPEKPADATAAAPTGKTDWPSLRRDIFAALKNKERGRLRSLIGQLTDLTGPQKDILLTNLKASGLDQNTQMQLRKLIDKAAVSEEHFLEIANLLNENQMTWADLGFKHVYREPRTRTVILL